jgi:hypothetical protein
MPFRKPVSNNNAQSKRPRKQTELEQIRSEQLLQLYDVYVYTEEEEEKEEESNGKCVEISFWFNVRPGDRSLVDQL